SPNVWIDRGGRQRAGDQGQRRHLPRPIRPDEGGQLARPHLECEAAHGDEVAEAAGKRGECDGGAGGHGQCCAAAEADDGGAASVATGSALTSNRTSAGTPGFSSSALSPAIATFTAYTSFTRSSAVCTLRGVNSASPAMKTTRPS